MAIKKILTVPDQILRKKSLPVEEVNKEIKVELNTLDDKKIQKSLRFGR